MSALTALTNAISAAIITGMLLLITVIIALGVIGGAALEAAGRRRALRHRQRQARIATEPMAAADALALAVVCPPCNDEPRRSDRTVHCTCAGSCGHPACGRTGLFAVGDAEIEQMIADYERGSRG